MKTKLILTALCTLTFLLFTCAAIAEIRYVSKTGTATPPYTSWATASDSIQKCINICNDGDTVIVANGVYKEHLKIYSSLTLIGMSTDSTIIDGRGIISTGLDSSYTIMAYKNLEIKNFHIFGHDQTVITGSRLISSIRAINNIIENAWNGINFPETENNAAINNIIFNVKDGIGAGDFINAASYSTIGNVIISTREAGYGINHMGGGAHNIINNIILHTDSEVFSEYGIQMIWPGRSQVRDNLIAGFKFVQYNDGGQPFDTVFIVNNAFGYAQSDDVNRGLIDIVYGNKKEVKNNMFFNSKQSGIYLTNETLHPDYNLYWNVKGKYYGANIVPGQNEIVADPMFVKDKVPNNNLDFDFHLQKYSPAIDAGDPAILDVDGTRSDIGMFGGPYGEKYTYQDLAPRNPVNVTAEYIDGLIHLKWNKNTTADFYQYRIYRDTVSGFIINPTKLIASVSDTFYNDNVSSLTANSYYYKLTSVDSTSNGSAPSEEIRVVITGLGEMPPKIVEDYKLMQNYPNPFNPSTKIGYRLKEPGYVKVMVYNIIGERLAVLVNGYQSKGYHEVDFTSKKEYLSGMLDKSIGWEIGYGDIVSGIYLYRIEVIGEGNIPVFFDCKKMILVK